MGEEAFLAYRREIIRRSQQKRRASQKVRSVDYAAAKQRRLAKKAVLVEKMGGSCRRCGWRPERPIELSGMDFHHKDPTTKQRDFGGQLARDLAALEAEAVKCELLCARCHRIVEAEIAQSLRT